LYPSEPSLPIGFAHRGARAERPDNTIASFVRAIELGANAVESDAWLTADGHVVLDHDGVVRHGWRRRPIASLTLSELPSHVPQLSQLYDRCGTGLQVSLDVKDPAVAGPTLEVAHRLGAVERLWLCSPDAAALAGWRALAAQVHLVWSTERAALGARDHSAQDHSARDHSARDHSARDHSAQDLTARNLGALRDRGIDAVNLRATSWDRDLVEEVHRHGLLAFGWDAQRDEQLDRVLGMGVDGVYSDHVERMYRALARHPRPGAV
jgi:glycerophosphoryl diester phosphodiesterase